MIQAIITIYIFSLCVTAGALLIFRLWQSYYAALKERFGSLLLKKPFTYSLCYSKENEELFRYLQENGYIRGMWELTEDQFGRVYYKVYLFAKNIDLSLTDCFDINSITIPPRLHPATVMLFEKFVPFLDSDGKVEYEMTLKIPVPPLKTLYKTCDYPLWLHVIGCIKQMKFLGFQFCACTLLSIIINMNNDVILSKEFINETITIIRMIGVNAFPEIMIICVLGAINVNLLYPSNSRVKRISSWLLLVMTVLGIVAVLI